MMISRRRHNVELTRQRIAHACELAEAELRRHRDVAATRDGTLALAGVWLQGRAAGYRADANAEPSKPKTGPLTDDARLAIADELEVCARDIAGLDTP